MKRTGMILLLALASLGLQRADAQTTTTIVRGKVVDDDGKPVPDVKIEMEFKGESRVKIVKNAMTDKHGGYVRSGLPSGPYRWTFTKEGYKTYAMDLSVTLGGTSDIPDVKISTAAAAPATPASAAVEAVLPAAAESAKVGENYSKAVEAVKAGQLDVAEGLFKEVIVKFPDLAGAHYNLGYIYQTRKDWKGAEAEFKKVAEIQPTHSDAFIALAAVRDLDGRGQEGLDDMLKSAPAFEQDPKFQYALGVACADAGRSADAVAAFKKLEILDPSNPEAQFQLGTLAVAANNIPEALSRLERYVAMTGQNPQHLETAKRLMVALKPKKP